MLMWSDCTAISQSEEASSCGCSWCLGTQHGNVTSAGWQVTLWDPMWHVSSRSSMKPCELLYTCYLLTYSTMTLFLCYNTECGKRGNKRSKRYDIRLDSCRAQIIQSYATNVQPYLIQSLDPYESAFSRVVTCSPQSCSPHTLLQQLHWLPLNTASTSK